MVEVDGVDNISAFEGLRSLKQGYEALGKRSETSKNMLSRMTMGLLREDGVQAIDNASATLNKYYGQPVIDKNYTNQHNRDALQTMFHNGIAKTSSNLQDLARKSGDIYSRYKIFELTDRLLSMPIDKYDHKATYAILDELETLGNKVALGVPLGIALNKSSSVKNIDRIHRDYTTRYKASLLDVADESMGAFLKSGYEGVVRSTAGAADIVLNVVGNLLGKESHSYIMDSVEKFLPNITSAERRSILGQTGGIAGSLAAAFARYGVPTTVPAVLGYAVIPKGLEIMQNLFGIDNSIIDPMLAFGEAYAFKVRTAQGYTYLKQAYYPSVKGGISKKLDPVSKPKAIAGMINDNVDVATKKTGKSAEAFVEHVQNNLEHVEPTYGDKPTTLYDTHPGESVIRTSAGSNSSIPITYLEMSDNSKALAYLMDFASKSTTPELVETASKLSQVEKAVINDAILETFVGEDYNVIDNTPTACGESFKELFTEADQSFRDKANVYYTDAENIIEYRNDALKNNSTVRKQTKSELNSLREKVFPREVTLDHKEVSARRDALHRASAMPYLESYLTQAELAEQAGDMRGVAEALNTCIKESGKTVRSLSKTDKSFASSKLLSTIEDVKQARNKLYEYYSEPFPEIGESYNAAKEYYAEHSGALKDLFNMDINGIKRLTPEAMQRKLSSTPSALADLNKLLKNITPVNEDLVRSYNKFISILYANELRALKIVPGTHVVDGALIMKNKRIGTGSFSRMLSLDSDRQKFAALFSQFYDYNKSNYATASSSRVSLEISKLLDKFVSKIPIVGKGADIAKSVLPDKKARDVLRILKDRLNNAHSHNIQEGVRLASSLSENDYLSMLKMIRVTDRYNKHEE